VTVPSLFRLATPLGALLFTLAWIVLGAISPGYQLFDVVIDEYSSISQPISGLGLGVTGPSMNAAFVVSGALITAGLLATIPVVRGSRLRTVGIVLVSFLGVGMIVDGIFTLESVMLHLVGFLLAVPVPAVGLILFGIGWVRERRLLGGILIAGGIATLGLFALFMVTFDPYGAGDNVGVSGLIQRVLVTVPLVLVSTIALVGARRAARRALPTANSAIRPAALG
jgi:hypothetical protein